MINTNSDKILKKLIGSPKNHSFIQNHVPFLQNKTFDAAEKLWQEKQNVSVEKIWEKPLQNNICISFNAAVRNSFFSISAISKSTEVEVIKI